MNIAKLRAEIVYRYKTQTAFASAIGWTENKLSKMMTGKYKPDTDEVAKIVEALRLDERQYCDIFLPSLSPIGDKRTAV